MAAILFEFLNGWTKWPPFCSKHHSKTEQRVAIGIQNGFDIPAPNCISLCKGITTIDYLSVLVQNGPVEVEVVGETLRPSALSNRDNSRLLRMQHSTLFPHRLGVSHGGGEEAVPSDPAVEPGPVIVPVARVRQAPRDQGVFLLVRIHALLALAGHAETDTAESSVLTLTLKIEQAPVRSSLSNYNRYYFFLVGGIKIC